MTTVAYIDETGTNSLEINKEGVSRYFIICAVLIDKSDEDQLNNVLSNIRSKHTNNAELKSSKIRSLPQRIKILEELDQIDYKIKAIIVDKKQIKKSIAEEGFFSGLQYKNTFYKNIPSRLYVDLANRLAHTEIFADDFGNDKFKKEFQKYLDQKLGKETLPLLQDVRKLSIETVSSKESNGVQLADFIVGSLAKWHEASEQRDLHLNHIGELLKSHRESIQIFPPRYNADYLENTFTNISTTEDSIIKEYAIALAWDFISKNGCNPDDDIQIQVIAMQKMIDIFEYESCNKYIYGEQISNHLKQHGFEKMNKEAVRRKVISKLRDQGVLICSNKNGYKIPSCVEDISKFFKEQMGKVNPMMDRLIKANDKVKSLTNSRVCMITALNYDILKKQEELKFLNKDN